MIRTIEVKVNAAFPELPLYEATAFIGAPTTAVILGVPKRIGNWEVTQVQVAYQYPDNSTGTRIATKSAAGVWVATLPATMSSGRVKGGFQILAGGIDERGEAVSGYVLGIGDFAVYTREIPVAPESGPAWTMHFFDTAPTTPKAGDVAVVDGTPQYYDGTAWQGFVDPSALRRYEDLTVHSADWMLTLPDGEEVWLAFAGGAGFGGWRGGGYHLDTSADEWELTLPGGTILDGPRSTGADVALTFEDEGTTPTTVYKCIRGTRLALDTEVAAVAAKLAADYYTATQTDSAISAATTPIAQNLANNYYTAQQTDAAIERVAAYYITYTAAGAAFPTRAALVGASTYYSGGVVRTPTRNDYAVVLADETHDGAEWRYIYAVADGATTGQWEAQYPIETNDYTALSNKPQIGGVPLQGNQTPAQLGLATEADLPYLIKTTAYYTAALPAGIEARTNGGEVISDFSVVFSPQSGQFHATSATETLVVIWDAEGYLVQDGGQCQFYDRISEQYLAEAPDLELSDGVPLLGRACNELWHNASTTSITLAMPPMEEGRARDLFVDVDNEAGQADITLDFDGLGLQYVLAVASGDVLADLLVVEAGTRARYYITETAQTYTDNNLTLPVISIGRLDIEVATPTP